MRVVIRADASVWIGSGHIMRCLVLADALKSLGHEVIFACLPLEGNLFSIIEQRGFPISQLSLPENPIAIQHDADYSAWLQRPQEQDAADFISNINHADLVVTDHYAIDHVWQDKVREALQCKLVALDDLRRSHSADLVIDQTLGRKSNDYPTCERVLAGTSYALLSPQFVKYRNRAFCRKTSDNIPRILISMGGVDLPNATSQVINAVVGTYRANFTVLLSPRSPHYQQVKTMCEQIPNVTHLDFSNNMAELMLDHDCAIGAPGTTSWERACLGLPSIVIPLAENQRETSIQLEAAGAALVVQLNEIDSELVDKLTLITTSWPQYVDANLRICDGLGANRVVSEMVNLCHPLQQIENQYKLVPASIDDISIVYEWQRHPNTRRFALNPDVPSWEEHLAWINAKLKSHNDFFYMICEISTGSKVGVVRLDKSGQDYVISIFIDPFRYGKGIATEALRLVDTRHSDLVIKATVLKDNQASQKLFLNAKYRRLTSDTFIREPRN